jgi:hypothetical protein
MYMCTYTFVYMYMCIITIIIYTHTYLVLWTVRLEVVNGMQDMCHIREIPGSLDN